MRRVTTGGAACDIDIIALAFQLAETVKVLVDHARAFYYEVVLSAHVCPRCGGGLAMLAESRCRCTGCGHAFDPTVAFQRCGVCGGVPKLRICRYQCRGCGRDVPSRFVFDGLVFDAEYFRQRMAQSRQRKAQRQREFQIRAQESRSEELSPAAADLSSVPGLVEALNALVGGTDVAAWLPLCRGFDLKRYQSHLLAQLADHQMDFDDVAPLDEDRRLDRIWRFVAMIFLAHGGLIRIEQDRWGITLTKARAGTDAGEDDVETDGQG